MKIGIGWAMAVLVACLSVGCGDRAASKSSASRHAPAKRDAPQALPLVQVIARQSSLAAFKGDNDDDEIREEHAVKNLNDKDADFDNDSKVPAGYYDSDDASVREYGRPPSMAARRAILTVTTKYLQAVYKADGAGACALLYFATEESVPEDVGEGGAAYAHGYTCASVLTKVFRHDHVQLAPPFDVVAVRRRGKRAYVLLASTVRPPSYMVIRQERGVWKVGTVLGLGFP